MAETSADALDLEQFEGHTPGPWFTFKPRWTAVEDLIGIKLADGVPVAYVIDSVNAELIAAVPDLLAEVRRLRAHQETLKKLTDEFEAERARIDRINVDEDRDMVIPSLTVFMYLKTLRAALSAGSPEPERTT